MRRTMTVIVIGWIVILAGCLPGAPDDGEREEVVEQEESDEQVLISRDINTSERYYRSILPYTPGASRGFILNGVANRLDIDQFDTGLMRLAQETFDPDQYFYREGQLLDESQIQSWIDRADESEEGLNQALGVDASASVKEKLEAHKEHPKVLSYILEQNYMVKKKDDTLTLGGIVIGLSLNSIYYYTVQDEQGRFHSGEVDLRDDLSGLTQSGKEMAQHVIRHIRGMEEGSDVPITVAIYLEEAEESLIPGRFIAMTSVAADESEISSWQELDERHYLFPSSEVVNDHRSDAEQFENFKAKIEDFFPNFTGVIGRGFYKNGELQHMVIDISMQFYGKAEIIAFTQYVTDLVDSQSFSNDVPLEVTISSLNQQESLIVKTVDMEEPYVHIYR